jgi:hypothetical protein
LKKVEKKGREKSKRGHRAMLKKRKVVKSIKK